MGRFAALLLLSTLLGACAEEKPATQVASIPQCAGSQDKRSCEGMPLCATVSTDTATCTMCRCSGYTRLPGDTVSTTSLPTVGNGTPPPTLPPTGP